MPVRNLQKVFQPQSVAVVGASGKAASVGAMVLKNLSDGGFSGPIYAVNPKHKRIGARECFVSVGQLPAAVDLAVVCTPAATVPGIVRECGAAGILGVVILSAGFRESGPEGAALEQAVREAAAEFDGLRIVGPNCLGVMAPHAKLNASFANGTTAAGQVAFISQSGALCTAVLDWALQENIGFSHFVSVGNMIDVTIGDLIDYFATDRWTESIILYVESITEAREFMSAARAFARRKPIIAYKAGRFAESAQAAASHTGALAGVDTVYEAALAPRRHRPRLRNDGHVRLRRTARPAETHERPPVGDRHQRRRSRRDEHRRAARASWRAGGVIRPIAEETECSACRPPGRTAIRSTCSAMPTLRAWPVRLNWCWPIPASTRCWLSSPPRR